MGEFKEHQGCHRGRPSDALTYGNTIALSLLEDCLRGGDENADTSRFLAEHLDKLGWGAKPPPP
ncbi:MAG: hypothetical protein ACO4AI_07820, partial [Prochlorothrix sp.]